MGLLRASAAALVLAALCAAGCAREKASLGDACRLNDDCESSYCLVEECANKPVHIDPALLPPPVVVTPADAGTDAPTD